MKFLFPEFLWALTVLAIPVLIHLFNFRRFKKVIFPNLRFLEEVQLKSKNRQQLRKYLVLLSRMLALSFLVLAFAQPFIPGEDRGGAFAGNTLSIYIDNSFSMNGENSEGELLEQAKNKARSLAATFAETDHFQLLTNDFEGRHQRAVSREHFLSWVDEIQPSAYVRNLSEVFERQKELLHQELQNGYNPMAFQISDFQQSVADLDQFVPDSLLSLFLIPVESGQQNNLSIDSLWLETPYVRSGEPVLLQISLFNYGKEDITGGTLVLEINGQQKGLAGFDCPAGTRKEISLTFTPEQDGWNQASIQLTDYPVTFDDKLYFCFEVRNRRKLLLIQDGDGAAKEIESVYRTDPYFVVETLSSGGLDYRAFPAYDLIIVNGLSQISSGLISELKAYVSKGGTLMLIPPQAEMAGFNELCQTLDIPALAEIREAEAEIDQVNLEHPVYREAVKMSDDRIPRARLSKWYARLPASGRVYDVLLSYGKDHELLSLHPVEQGRVYLFGLNLSPEWSELSRNFVFPLTLLQAGFHSVSGSGLYHTLGTGGGIPVKLEKREVEGVFELVGTNESRIPELQWQRNQAILLPGEVFKDAGNYGLRRKGEETFIRHIALNFDRRESNLTCLEEEEIEKRLSPGLKARVLAGQSETVGRSVQQINSGTPLWKAAILLVLLFVTIEILLLRFLKTS